MFPYLLQKLKNQKLRFKDMTNYLFIQN